MGKQFPQVDYKDETSPQLLSSAQDSPAQGPSSVPTQLQSLQGLLSSAHGWLTYFSVALTLACSSEQPGVLF